MDKIKKEIESRDFKNLYLFYGEEDYLKKKFRQILEKEVLEEGTDMMNYNYFEGKNVDIQKIIGACEIVPFMAEKRLVIVENSGYFSSGKAESSEALEKYIDKIPKSTILLFIEEKMLKTMRVSKKINSNKETCRVVELSKLPMTSQVAWAKSEAKKEGVQMDNKTAEYLFEITKSDMLNVSMEIKKLASYCMEKEKISIEDIDKLVNKSLEVKIFDLMDFIGNKKKDEAFSLFRELIEQKESPVKIVFMIEAHLRQVLQCKVFNSEGLTAQEIAKKIGSYDSYVRKFTAQGRNFTVDGLVNSMEKCVEADVAIKTGILNEVYALEMLIAEL